MAIKIADAPEVVLEHIAKNRGDLTGRLLAYVGSELVCHRAEERELAEAQQKLWQPLLDWCAEYFQAPLSTGIGIMPIKQPPESTQALRRAIEAFDDAHFSILYRAVQASGSLVIGLALTERRINAAQAFEAAELDALHQAKKWGEDEEIKARFEAIRRELELCEQEFKQSVN